MCFELNRKSYCYLIAIWAYTVGIFEVAYATYMMARFGVNYWLLGLTLAWIPIFFAALFLVVGAYSDSTQKTRKRALLKIWILVALVCGLAIIIIKIVIMIPPWRFIGIWRNCLRIAAVFFFILLIFSFVYYPYLYMHDGEEEFDI